MPLRHSGYHPGRDDRQPRREASDSPLPASGPEPSDRVAHDLATIAALSRIRRGAEDDVTDFLEFVRKKKYLLTGIDFDSAPPLPGGARGDNALTREQAEALRQEFDTGNLPSHQQFSLFRKLTELEVLTASDVRQTQFSVAPSKNDLMSYLTSLAGFRDVTEAPETDPKARLDRMIHNERFASRHVLSRYGRRCQAVDKLADSHQKVLDALRWI